MEEKYSNQHCWWYYLLHVVGSDGVLTIYITVKLLKTFCKTWLSYLGVNLDEGAFLVSIYHTLQANLGVKNADNSRSGYMSSNYGAAQLLKKERSLKVASLHRLLISVNGKKLL